MDEVFKALADASRRELLDRLGADNGQTLGELGGKFIEAVSGGWPKVLSNLKSLLETGDVAFQR